MNILKCSLNRGVPVVEVKITKLYEYFAGRDQEKCSLNEGDNYRLYIHKEKCSLNGGDNYKDSIYIRRSVPLMEVIITKTLYT